MSRDNLETKISKMKSDVVPLEIWHQRVANTTKSLTKKMFHLIFGKDAPPETPK